MSDERSSRKEYPLEVKILIQFFYFWHLGVSHTFIDTSGAALRNTCKVINTVRYKIVNEKNIQKSKNISEKLYEKKLLEKVTTKIEKLQLQKLHICIDEVHKQPFRTGNHSPSGNKSS